MHSSVTVVLSPTTQNLMLTGSVISGTYVLLSCEIDPNSESTAFEVTISRMSMPGLADTVKFVRV